MKKSVLSILSILSILVIAQQSNSNPIVNSVSGTISHGSALTITTTLAGTKATPAPIKFEDFETADGGGLPVAGNVISSEIGYWTTTGTDSNSAKISQSQQRTINSARNTLCAQERSGGSAVRSEMAWVNNVGFGNGKIYVNYWIYYQWPQNIIFNPAIDYVQQKTLALSGAYDSSGGVLSLPTLSGENFWYLGVDDIPNTADDYTTSYFLNSGGSGQRSFDHNTFPHTENGNWYNFSLEVDQGTILTSDGSIKMSVSTAGFTEVYQAKLFSSTQIRDGGNLDAIKIGWFMAYVTQGTSNFYYDDIYMDNSWARVEIGDSADYDLCTHREMQIPTAWATDEISITVNQGSFADDDTGYLFVIDEDGVESDGYAITFGSDSTHPDVTLEADKQATSPTSYTFEFSVEPGRTATTVVSSGGFTVTCTDGDCTDDETETGIVSGVTSPTSDTLTVTDSSAETGNATINITLPPEPSNGAYSNISIGYGLAINGGISIGKGAIRIGSPSSTELTCAALLLEDGGALLLEDGTSALLLE